MATAAMLAIALSLGFWQVQRLHWKRGLLAEIDAGEATGPVPLTGQPPAFRRVVVTGRFLPGVARYGTDVRPVAGNYTMGTQLLSVLQPASGEPVVIDRGWAPEGFDATPPAGAVTVTGYVRPPELPSRFGAGNDVAARRFFSLDPAAIGRSLGVDRVEPFTVVALGSGGGLPQPAFAMPRPPNDHLSYALTWFALAITLLVIFGIYARQVLRERPGP